MSILRKCILFCHGSFKIFLNLSSAKILQSHINPKNKSVEIDVRSVFARDQGWGDRFDSRRTQESYFLWWESFITDYGGH